MRHKIILIVGILSLLFGAFLFISSFDSFTQKDINDLSIIYEDEYSTNLKDNNSNKISLNIASLDELKKLSDIGDVRANQIIEYRNKQKFTDTYELVTAKIIGDKIYDKIKDKITI